MSGFWNPSLENNLPQTVLTPFVESDLLCFYSQFKMVGYFRKKAARRRIAGGLLNGGGGNRETLTSPHLISPLIY
ncbi:hypothetical protein Pla110_22490 [Polystyrenella longa]|uniref:Uncharacterized protein n=1 Tax=Polystyrenella longa TaxID=2528007 RepID=A0A518CMR6_9PLAN|nr:hypothetical protein Pla110_22490 [Polystyrenella longa]